MADDEGGGAPEWMCTFSDMMSLLLCFFVLLFSMSNIEKKKLIEAAGSLRAAFGGLPAPYISQNIPDKSPKEEMSRPHQPVRKQSFAKEELRREEARRVRSMNLQNVIQVTGTELGVTFRLSGDALFDAGKAELKAEAIVALKFIAQELIQFPLNPITIAGHTDPTGEVDENWILGAERAYEVMKYMIQFGSEWGQLSPKQITYESFGSFHPLPDTDNTTKIGRSLNRRVEITLIQTDDGDGPFFRDSTVRNPRTPLLAPGLIEESPQERR